MNLYRLELVEPGVIFDAVHVWVVRAKNWKAARVQANRLIELHGRARFLNLRRLYNTSERGRG